MARKKGSVQPPPRSDRNLVVVCRPDENQPVTITITFSITEAFRAFEDALADLVHIEPGTEEKLAAGLRGYEDEFKKRTPNEAILTPGAKLPLIGGFASTCVLDFCEELRARIRSAAALGFVAARDTGALTARFALDNSEPRIVPKGSSRDLLARPEMKPLRDAHLEMARTTAPKLYPKKRGAGAGRKVGSFSALKRWEAQAILRHMAVMSSRSRITKTGAAEMVASDPDLRRHFKEHPEKTIRDLQARAHRLGLDEAALSRIATSKKPRRNSKKRD